MAIQQHWSEQFSSKLSKGTSKKLYWALKYTCLQYSLHMRWQELKHKRRWYLRGNWSNLQKAQDILKCINDVAKEPVNQLALDNLIADLEEAKSNAPIHLEEDTDGWRLSFTPEEYQLQNEAFQFVLDEFDHPYHRFQIPHLFKYQEGTRGYCSYETVPYSSGQNGGHYYRMEIDPTGTYSSNKWYTYGRSSLGWRAEGIPVPPEFSHIRLLVHEVTHAIENYRSHRTNRGYSQGETNTTLMELRYAKQHYPQFFRQLTPVMDGRRNEWWSPIAPLPDQNPKEQLDQSDWEQKMEKAAGPPAQ